MYTCPQFSLICPVFCRLNYWGSLGPKERLQLSWCFTGMDRDLVCGSSSAAVSKMCYSLYSHRKGLWSASQRRKETKGISWHQVSRHCCIVYPIFGAKLCDWHTIVWEVETATGFFLQQWAERAHWIFRMPEFTLSSEKHHSSTELWRAKSGWLCMCCMTSDQQELLLMQTAGGVEWISGDESNRAELFGREGRWLWVACI